MIEWEQRAIALAGLVQASQLVVQLARHGIVGQDTLSASLASIFVQIPGSVADVFQGTRGIRTGLNLLTEMLTSFDAGRHGEILGYSMAVINLERKLAAQPAMLREIGALVASADEQRMRRDGQDGMVDEETIARLAEIYHATLSRIEPRIKIQGDPARLQRTETVNKIRALLLAGVRSAVLWHQVGGRRWHLLLSRRKLRDAASNLL